MRSDAYGPSVDKPRLSRRRLRVGLGCAGAVAVVRTTGRAAAVERMAAGGADVPTPYQSALAANRIWHPRKTMGVAVYLSREGNRTPQQVPQRAIGRELFSATGYGRVEDWLAARRGMTPKAAGDDGGCSV